MTAKREFPPLRSLPKRLEAAYYNRVRLALRRLGCPLRVALPQHRGLEAILDNDAWVCVDTTRGDLPVLAWRAFGIHGRESLHEPIDCRLELYPSGQKTHPYCDINILSSIVCVTMSLYFASNESVVNDN